MRVDAADGRPSSLLRGESLDAKAILGGAGVTLGAHLVLPLLVMMVLTALELAGVLNDEPPPLREENVVEAHFVKLGEKRDPKKLPNRKVPRKSTAPDKKTVVSKDPKDNPPPEKEEERPPEPEEDLLTRLGDRAHKFAEIAEKREQEGNPEGVEDGTAQEARAGNIYAGKIREFFKRGWSVPETISHDVLQGLVARVSIRISSDGYIESYEIVRSSGDPLFDQSVESRIAKLQEDGKALPEPPEEVADKYWGTTFDLNFKGRDASQ